MNGCRQIAPQDQSNDEWLAERDGRVTEMEPQQTSVSADTDCMVESAPLVPMREYRLAYVEHFTQKVRGAGKLQINFSITESAYSGLILPAYYRVKLTGPPGKFGSFKASAQGEYYEQMCDLFPSLIGGRSDRISPRRLKGQHVIGTVETVTTKWNGEPRKEHTQYSKVKKLIKLC